MLDLALDADGDLAIVSGDASFVDGADQLRQHLQIRLRFFRAEWFLDENAGVPYFQQIFVKGTPLARVHSVITNEILATPDVSRLLAFSTNFDSRTRKLTVDFAVDSRYGQVNVSGEIL